MKNGTIKLSQFLAGAATVMFCVAGLWSAQARAAETKKVFSIDAKTMAQALIEFSEQSDANLVAPGELIAGKLAPAVKGKMAPQEALERLLRNSGLGYAYGADGEIKIIRMDTAAAAAASYNIKLAYGAGNNPASAPVSASGASASSQVGDQRNQIVVTGTHIRGAAPDSVPVIILDRDYIEKTGYSTTQQLIQSLPQNFGGGSNENLIRGVPNDSSAGRNTAAGSSANLRGLGSTSTLVLINGRRLAGAGSLGGFVDISLIPINAIDRVEVLTDGASSIYGGDAVAGVVNFILRDDYDGAETSLRYGTVTEGALDEMRVGQTLGKDWRSGNVLLSGDYYKRDSLSALERDFSRAIGEPIGLLPKQERYTVLLTARQALSDRVQLNADALYANRETQIDRVFDPISPLFTSHAETEQVNVAAGLEIDLWRGWVLETNATYSESASAELESNGTQTFRTQSELWHVDAKSSGALFNIPGGSVRFAGGLAYREEDLSNRSLTVVDAPRRGGTREVLSAFGEVLIPLVGADNAIRGISRLELNVSARYEDYSDFGTTTNPKYGLYWSPLRGFAVRASYSTSFNPPDLGRLNTQDLAVDVFSNDIINAALGPFFNFDPQVSNPDPALLVQGTDPNIKQETSDAWTLGFEFKRNAGEGLFSLRANYFDIEFSDRINLVQVPISPFNIYNVGLSQPGFFPAGVLLSGSQVNPQAVQATIAQAIMERGFRDQFRLITSGADPIAPNDPATLERIDFASVGLIANLFETNLSRAVVSGFDMEVDYGASTVWGDWLWRLSGTYLTDYETQASISTPVVEALNSIYNPADLKVRAGVSWSRAGWSVSSALNYVDSYSVDGTSGSNKIDSWTTIDLDIAYRTADRLASVGLDNTRIALSVLNLFNDEPPSVGTPNYMFAIFNYDPTNANPLGRFASVQIVKSW